VAIAIKSIVDLCTEILPGPLRNLSLHRLVPQRSGTIKVHLGQINPLRLMDEVHFEILLGTGFPTAWIVTIEPRKGNFRKFAIGIIQVIGIGWVVVCAIMIWWMARHANGVWWMARHANGVWWMRARWKGTEEGLWIWGTRNFRASRTRRRRTISVQARRTMR